MRQAVLADTGPLYAAVDRDDQYHAQAQEELAHLAREQLTVVTLYSTLVECYTLVLRHLGLNTAHRWLREMVEGAALVNPTADDYGAAAARLRVYPDQPITLADAVLVVVSARLQCPVWTYDYHFDLMQASIWR